jgi:hypothetical protein
VTWLQRNFGLGGRAEVMARWKWHHSADHERVDPIGPVTIFAAGWRWCCRGKEGQRRQPTNSLANMGID